MGCRRRHHLAALLILGVLGAPSGAVALVVDDLRLAINPARTDKLTIRGRFDALVLEGAESVVLTVDRFRTAVPIAELVRKRHTLSYRGPRGAGGLARLAIDLNKRTFKAAGKDLALAGITHVVVATLGTDLATECALVQLAEPGGVKREVKAKTKPPRRPASRTLKRLRGNAASTACVFPTTPAVLPATIRVGVATDATIEIAVEPSAVPALTRIEVRELDADGAPTGLPLCTLADAGVLGDRVAGDGTYSCTHRFEETEVGTIRLLVDADVGGIAVRSRSVHVPIAPLLTEPDVALAIDLQRQASEIWLAVSATLGDSLAARVETLRRLRAVAGIRDAVLSPNGDDVAIVFASGIIGGLLLSERFPSIPTPTPSPSLPLLRRAPAPAAPRSGAAGTECPFEDERAAVESRNVFLWDGGYFAASESAAIEALFGDHCLPFTLEKRLGQAAGVAALADMAGKGTILLVSHGIVDPHGRVMLVTGQDATKDAALAFEGELDRGLLGIAGLPGATPMREVFVVSTAYIAGLPRLADDAIVHGGTCWSAFEGQLANAFFARGAGVYTGFDERVGNGHARSTAIQLFEGLLLTFATTGQAYDEVAPKLDPRHGDRGVGVAPRPKPAFFHQIGRRDLAYTDSPEIAPAESSVDAGDVQPLVASLADAEECELTYEWSANGGGGTLEDDEGNAGTTFTSTDESVNYVAGDVASEDQVAVGLRPPAPNDDEPVFAGACATVRVTGCGDGVKQPGETCDGPDDDACPGQCSADCTCLQCGNGALDPGEQCDVGHDDACPDRCQGDCQCSPCTPGDPNTCGATRCCNPATGLCCTPRVIGADPPCPFAMNSCCGTPSLDPNFCLGPGPSACPISCQDPHFTVYSCITCDAKLVERYCTATACSPE